MPVDVPKQNRLSRILILTIAVVAFFVLAVGGYSWWVTRPVSCTLVTPVSAHGATLLTASATRPMLPENEMAFMPALLRMASRMHRYTTEWERQNSGGKPAAKINLNLKFEDTASVWPVALGKDRLLAAVLPDTVAIFDLSGGRLNQYAVKGHTVRSVAASPDGRWTAWAVSLPVAVKAPQGSLNRDPYDLTMAPPSPDRQTGTFRLFIADQNLARIREISIVDTYPALGPGSMTWDASPALYYTGYDAADHTWRTTYRVDPRSGSVQPVAAKRDWGAVFALSPGGKTAAAVGDRGLTLTDTATGDQNHLWPGAPSERVLPEWDSAGRRVAFLLKPIGGAAASIDRTHRITQKDMRVVIADTSSFSFPSMSEPVMNFTCGVCRPYWSPDGKRVFINGTVFDERTRGLFVARRVVLCYDTASGAVSYPTDFQGLWK